MKNEEIIKGSGISFEGESEFDKNLILKLIKKARQEGIKLGFIEGYKEAIFIKGEILKLDFKNMQEHLNNMEGIEYSTKLKKLIKKGSEKSK